MGYETELILDVVVPANRRAAFRRALQRKQRDTNDEAHYIFQQLRLSKYRSVEFGDPDAPGASGELVPAVCPDEEEGLVTAVYLEAAPSTGKWYHTEELAHWLCAQGCEGRIIQQSRESDGDCWGWEFARGYIRTLNLRPSSKWRKVEPEPEPDLKPEPETKGKTRAGARAKSKSRSASSGRTPRARRRKKAG